MVKGGADLPYFELDCELKGTRVGSEYSHTDEVAMPRRPSTRVARYVEFPIMNEPKIDPYGFFANVKPQMFCLCRYLAGVAAEWVSNVTTVSCSSSDSEPVTSELW